MGGQTPVMMSVLRGRTEMVRMLLEDGRKIDPAHLHSDGFSPLHRACWGNEPRHTDTVKVFVEEAGVPWDLVSKKGTTCYDVTGNSATRNFLKKVKEQEKKKKKEL